MRRILIDSELKNKAENYSKNLFAGKRKDFKTPLDNLTKLKDDLGGSKHGKRKQYVQKIIDNYNEILKASPSEMEEFIKQFSTISKGGLLESTLTPSAKLKFHELIVSAMRYEELRNSEFRQFVNSSGIKTCVYCNSQLAIISEISFYDKKKKRRKTENISEI